MEHSRISGLKQHQPRKSRPWTQKYLETTVGRINILTRQVKWNIPVHQIFSSNVQYRYSKMYLEHFQILLLEEQESEPGDRTVNLGGRLARGPCIPGLGLARCPGRAWTSRGKVKYREGRAWVLGTRSSVGAMAW